MDTKSLTMSYITPRPILYQTMNTSFQTINMIFFSNKTTGSFNDTFQHYDDTLDDICDVMSLPHRDYTQIPAVTFIIAVVYIFIIVCAITGNVLVILTVWRNPHMHTVTNYYIVNLAISDLLVSSLVMPLKLLEYTAPCHWHVFGSDALCSVLYYLLPIFVFASVLTLVAISLERYYAIVHPLSAMKLSSKSRTRKIIAVTWIIPIILASPYTYCRSYAFDINSDLGQISRQICNDRFDEIDVAIYGEEAIPGHFRRGFFIFLFFAVYVIPMTLILVTCIKIAWCLLQPISFKRSPPLGRKDASRRKHEENKRKVARMVIVIAIAFIVSWSPQYLVSIISQFQSINGDTFLREGNFLFIMLMTHLCGFLNSCINPFVYTVMSQKFRRSFKQILGSIFCCCLTRHIFRYRDSFNRDSRSGAYTSTIRQSLEDVREGLDVPMNDVPSSGGSSNDGSNSNRIHRISSKNTGEMTYILPKQKQKRNNYGRRQNKTSSKPKSYQIMLKCMKKKNNDVICNRKKIVEHIAMQIKQTSPIVRNNVGLLDNGVTHPGDSVPEVIPCQEVANDVCSESDGSERGIRISTDQIEAIRKEHECSLSEVVNEDDKRFRIMSTGYAKNGNCVQL